MKAFVSLSLLFLLFSCNNRPVKQKDATTGNPSSPDTLCFLRTEGRFHQDTTELKMVIREHRVSGSMVWKPYEKDVRKGSLKGVITDQVIEAIWVYLQEGVTDSLAVEFKLDRNNLLRKGSKFDRETGRETLDSASDYSIVYNQVDCD